MSCCVLIRENYALQTLADVEALAARKAILFNEELDLKSIILEGDSEIIAQALQKEDQSFASYGHLIKEAQIYAEFFHSFRVFHFCLRGNFVTHNLIRLARYVSGLVVWMEEVPPHLNSILLANYG